MANVLMLMSDEHNFRVSSVYGHQRVQTPNMDRLAAHGTVFDAAYCNSSLCAPSRSSFMAGLPVHQTQVYNNCNVMNFDLPSYGSVLKEQGTHTIYIGKTDVFNTSDMLGFTEMLLPGDRQPPGDTNFGRDPLTIREDGPGRADGYGPRDHAFANDLRVVDTAVEWLSNTAATADGQWAMTVNIGAPHFPHYVTPELWDKYEDGGDLPEIGVEQESAQHPYAQDLRRHFQTEGFSEEQIRGLRRGYLGCVDFVDTQLGRLLDALEAIGQRDDTVVIYTSDHGEMLGKFGMWWKCSMYEDSVRVPLIIAGPGFERRFRNATPVSLLDVQASFFHATGARRPDHRWGSPLQDVETDDSDRIGFSEYHGHGTRSGAFMIRQDQWKLVYNMAAPHQLFDLNRDPEELDNRYGQEPQIGSQLEEELRRLCSPERENRRAHAFEHRQMELLGQLTA